MAAAAWVAKQVSPDTVVACDSQMRRALVAHGFPSDKVLVLHPASQYQLSSELVIVTASVRNMFGSSLSIQWAPAVIATFGSRTAQISIRLIAPHGAAAYQREVAADLQNRKAVGGELLRSNQISQSTSAGKQMADGLVDLRVLVAISDLAAAHPVYIEDFGNLATGAASGIPLRYADVAEGVNGAGIAGSADLHAMAALLAALPADYRPMHTATVKLPGGVSALRIEFGAPTPLLLLAPAGSTS